MIKQGTHIISGSPTPNIIERKVIELTKSAYQALLAEDKIDPEQYYLLTDDEAPNIIDDTSSSYSNVYSAAHTLSLINTVKNTVYTKEETEAVINHKLSSALKYKGSVAAVAGLPVSASNGDTYYVSATGLLYSYNSANSVYDQLGEVADMTNYFTKTEMAALLADKNIQFQYSTIPTANEDNLNKVVQYIGATNENYKKGNWYQCVDNSGTYSWELLSSDAEVATANSVGTVQPGSSLDIDENGVINVNSKYKKVFIGTKTEWSATTNKSDYDLVSLTDDFASGEQVIVDTIENGNLNAVSSNAVYNHNRIQNISLTNFSISANGIKTVALTDYGISTNGKPWLAFIWNRSSSGLTLLGDGTSNLLVCNVTSEDLTVSQIQIAVMTQE